jgi:pimeloyl-ACP methyl ester carboxylesterase
VAGAVRIARLRCSVLSRPLWEQTAAEAWADGLDQTADGWRLRFDIDVIERTLRAELSVPTWSEWEQVRCPALVVRGERGTLTPELADEMLARLPGALVVAVAGGGHDVHLDQPERLAATLQKFLRELR